jgi:hypothetical protein
MSLPLGLFLALIFCLWSPIFGQQTGVQNEPEGLIHLDVVVTNHAGKPVSGMDRVDFTLLDNGRSEKIVSFHAFGGINAQPNPPAALILLIDTRNVPKETASDVRRGVEKFLRRNSLTEPVTIYSLEGTGFWLEAGPSLDGNALAAAVEHGDKLALLHPPPLFFQVGESPTNVRKNLLDRPYLRQPSVSAL